MKLKLSRKIVLAPVLVIALALAAFTGVTARGALAAPRTSASISLAGLSTTSSSGEKTVTVAPGDTLSRLAQRYGTTVEALQELNGLGTSTIIYAGATLRIPDTGSRIAGSAGASPAAAITFARAQLGKPYIWGGAGSAGYDCSGLVMRAWEAGGVSLPRTTYAQVNAGTRITRDELAPGDLIFTNADGHVELYIGGGHIIQAPHTGSFVQVSPLPPAYLVDAYVRVARLSTPIGSTKGKSHDAFKETLASH